MDLIEGIEGIKKLLENPESVGFIFHLISLILISIFFIIRENINNKKVLNSKFDYSEFIILTLIGSVISSTLILIIGSISILFSPVVGCVSSIIIFNKFINPKKKKDDEDGPNINITINNGNEPEIKLPDNVNFNNLDILTILEIYGYVSGTQKERLLKSSLLETTDEMIKKLLMMSVIEKSELNEAYALLNLARLKKKLVTKEEAKKYLNEYENSHISTFNNRR